MSSVSPLRDQLCCRDPEWGQAGVLLGTEGVGSAKAYFDPRFPLQAVSVGQFSPPFCFYGLHCAPWEGGGWEWGISAGRDIAPSCALPLRPCWPPDGREQLSQALLFVVFIRRTICSVLSFPSLDDSVLFFSLSLSRFFSL